MTIDPRTVRIIDVYVQKAREEKWPLIEFSWGWEEEHNKHYQKIICQYCMAKYMGCRIKNVGWGMTIEFKHD